MADLQSLKLFIRYEEEFEWSERIVLPRRNMFQEYDDAKFHHHLRLVEVCRHETAGWDTMQNVIIDTSCRQICDYKIREVSSMMVVYNEVHMDLGAVTSLQHCSL